MLANDLALHQTLNLSLATRYPTRATAWRIRTRLLELSALPQVMGILNVTPDSFSDGGKFNETNAAVDHALGLIAAGATILDIGGESTRPYSESVTPREQLARVLPVIESLRTQISIPISIDTSSALVAREALAAGAEIINDVTALSADAEMLSVALETQAGVCAMHMQGTPQTMQDNPTYQNVVTDVLAYLAKRRDELISAGISAERIALDPGIGFGKTHQHNLTLCVHASQFHRLGCPLLIGHSRKAFLGKLIGDPLADRTAATVGVALALAAQGVQILRVHDVEAVHQALVAFVASGGIAHATPTC